MESKTARAEINMAKIPVSADIPGLIFTVGTVMTFYWGIPEIRYVFPAAIVVGLIIALGLHFIRHENPPASYIPH
jgi:hypothetical protein